jgi:DNA-binding MarR family transcriptional regulator
VRQIDLADAMELQPITLARLIDQLAAAGLVERRADPADRRAYRVYLLPAAQNELATIEREAATIRARALQGLDATQADATLAALRIMQRNLSGR